MMPSALANAIFAAGSRYAPAPVPTFHSIEEGSNVVRVDFKRRAPLAATKPADPLSRPADNLWREIAADRLAALARFVDGWDGPASRSIPQESRLKALVLLDAAFTGVRYPAPPAVVPCGDGSLQLEWWLTDTRFEVSISSDGDLEAWGCDRVVNHEVEAFGSASVELLSKWASRLTADKLSTDA